MPKDMEIRAFPLLASSLGNTVQIIPEERMKSKRDYPREKDGGTEVLKWLDQDCPADMLNS